LVHLAHNAGKAPAQNEAVKQASGDILLFTDANVSLQRDAACKLVRHFQDETVGCAVGRVTYTNAGETGVSEGEGFYWRYELFVRRNESRLGNLVAGSGPILPFRRALFEPLDPAVSEDFVLPMQAALKGTGRCRSWRPSLANGSFR
jgi:cellulose synthase/poly-beta-1,6-N-acetylglucosamine synthase-like glycosyltransferase